MGMALKEEPPQYEQKKEQAEHRFPEAGVHDSQKHARWSIAIGMLEVMLGLLAIGAPFVAGMAAVIFVGALLLVSGVARVIRVVMAQSFGQGALALLAGVLAIGCGVLVLGQPLLSLGALTLILAAYFVVEGIGCLVLSSKVRPHSAWRWLLLDGIVTTILAFVIVAQWPLSSVWALGTLVGIDIFVTGAVAISIGWQTRVPVTT